MYLWGFSLNNLSLMALIVATGLVVDDAIVVLENISRHIELGLPPFEAAIVGAREVGSTLLSMNLSLVAVFVSILFMGGIVERLFREFSITLVAAIVISLVVSLTLTPMLCARWLRRSDARPGRTLWQRISERRIRAAAARLRPIAGLGAAARAAGHLPAARRDRAQRAPLHRRAEELPAAAGHRPARRLHPRRRRPVVPGDAAEDRDVPPARCWPIRRSRASAGFIGGGRGINNAQTFVRLKPLARAQGLGAEGGRAHPAEPAARCPARASGCSSSRTSASAVAAAAAGTVRVHAARRRHARCCGCGARTRAAARCATLPELTGFERRARLEPAGDADRRSRRRRAGSASRWRR